MKYKSKGKLQSKWEEPFQIKIDYLNGAYRLAKPDNELLMMPVNGNFLKKYYPRLSDKSAWDSLQSC